LSGQSDGYWLKRKRWWWEMDDKCSWFVVPQKSTSVYIYGVTSQARSLKLGWNGSVRVGFFFFFFFLTWVEKPKESSSILWFRQECLTAMCSNAPHVGYDMRVGLSNWEVLLFSSFSLIVLARYNTAHPYTNIYSFQVRKGTVVRKEKENQLWRKKRKSLIMLS